MSWLLRQLNRIPQPYRLIVFLISVAAAWMLVFMLFSQVQSCNYDRARRKYEQQKQEWDAERAKLIASAEEKERKVAELESQVAAFRAAAEQGKKVDEALAEKIDQVSKEAADEAARIDAPADCWVRGDRTCARLAGLTPPIVIDCDEYKRKLCSR